MTIWSFVFEYVSNSVTNVRGIDQRKKVVRKPIFPRLYRESDPDYRVFDCTGVALDPPSFLFARQSPPRAFIRDITATSC